MANLHRVLVKKRDPQSYVLFVDKLAQEWGAPEPVSRRFWRELFRLADLGRMEKWRMRLARSRSRSNEWRLWKLRLQQKKAESIEKDDIIEALRRRAREQCKSMFECHLTHHLCPAHSPRRELIAVGGRRGRMFHGPVGAHCEICDDGMPRGAR